MRHNLSGFLTLLGSLFLALPVFRWKFEPEWKNLRQPERFFYQLFGEKKDVLAKGVERDQKIPELLENRDSKRSWSTERMFIIVAFVLLVAGYLCSLDYRALSRCWDFIF